MSCEQTKALLGVSKSAGGYFWQSQLENIDETKQQLILNNSTVSPVVARVLAARGISDCDYDFIVRPRLRDLPDPSTIKNIDKAIRRVLEAIKNNESIGVIGDYDVDGVSSSALLYRYFFNLGIKITVLIPHREKDGYGPNIRLIDKLYQQGIKLVLMVDCGTSSHSVVRYASKKGLDCIVLDHHKVSKPLHEVVAFVNPQQEGDDSGLGCLCAAGVVFFFLIGLSRALRKTRYFDKIKEPDLKQLLDLVAVATISDMVPLDKVNRIIIKNGLLVLQHSPTVGLEALCKVAGVNKNLLHDQIAFTIGPRINAAGRLNDSLEAFKLLICDDLNLAGSHAIRLDSYNQKRREIESAAFENALKLLKIENNQSAYVYCSKKLSLGVAGLVASRLSKALNIPGFALSIQDGICKGSGRSIEGFNLFSFVEAAKAQGLLIAGGGHSMACGLSLSIEKLESFKNFMAEFAAQAIQSQGPRILLVDGIISSRALDISLAQDINMLGPFGAGFSRPVFALSGVDIVQAKMARSDTLLLSFRYSSRYFKAILFRGTGSNLSKFLSQSVNNFAINLAINVCLNEWNGESQLSLQVVDAAPCA